MALKKITAVITGRVQGVGFRYYVADKAELLGITGWVANQFDGSVKTVGVGDEESIQDFLLYLRKGPSMARIENVKYNIEDVERNEFSSFDIRFSL